MTQQLSFGRDAQGFNAFAPDPSTNKWSATLTDGTATSITLPTNFPVWVVSFRYYPNDVWVDVSGANAAVPGGATLTTTTADLNPSALRLLAGTKISMITAQDTADVSIVAWAVSYP